MADRYRTPGGWSVEVVNLGDHGDHGERLRIRHHGFHVADVATVAELARWIPAGELELLERDTLTPAARLALASHHFTHGKSLDPLWWPD